MLIARTSEQYMVHIRPAVSAHANGAVNTMTGASTIKLRAGQHSAGSVHRFQSAVLDWFAIHERDFPWRRTSNPFHILVAEVLLRQTQAKRITGPYLELIERYPAAQEMAGADVARLREWFKPLGLVKRADQLVEAAKTLLEQHGGEVPQDLAALIRLPGLGRYSARAILCLAFGWSVPMIDESSGRLLRRVLGLSQNGPAYLDRQLLEGAEGLLPRGASSAFNLGLLDIAARYCHPNSPTCEDCPLLGSCSYGQRSEAELEKARDLHA